MIYSKHSCASGREQWSRCYICSGRKVWCSVRSFNEQYSTAFLSSNFNKLDQVLWFLCEYKKFNSSAENYILYNCCWSLANESCSKGLAWCSCNGFWSRDRRTKIGWNAVVNANTRLHFKIRVLPNLSKTHLFTRRHTDQAHNIAFALSHDVSMHQSFRDFTSQGRSELFKIIQSYAPLDSHPFRWNRQLQNKGPQSRGHMAKNERDFDRAASELQAPPRFRWHRSHLHAPCWRRRGRFVLPY